jgi:uncharacterized protein
MRIFLASYIVTALCLAGAFYWGGWSGLFICALLVVMEVSFSFDNAVVNATVLKHMNATWQKRFLTWGMLVAVFGMYYLFPILIVSVATGLNVIDVTRMAFVDQESYSAHLMGAHTQIAAFGGMFLLMVFFKFIFDEGKDLHWLGKLEEKLAQIGKLEAVEIILALSVLLIIEQFLPGEEALTEMSAGVFGVVLYVAVSSLTALLGKKGVENAVAGFSGLGGFIYLNLLDASFSLDAVIGSFAISHDIVIIVLGLTAGAMFVRSLTVYLVRKGTLDHYVYLEHGAHYGIGALAVIMLVSMVTPVSEIITGLIGLAFILLSLWSSLRYNRERATPTAS